MGSRSCALLDPKEFKLFESLGEGTLDGGGDEGKVDEEDRRGAGNVSGLKLSRATPSCFASPLTAR